MELNKYVHTLRSSPFSDQKDAITLPDGVAHTYMALIREYPPPGHYPKTSSREKVMRHWSSIKFYQSRPKETCGE